MLFSYNWLQDYLKKKLPAPRKLAEILTLHAFEVEQIEKKEGDFLLDIDVLPNRAPDCFSHLGIAREISAILKIPFKEPKIKIKKFSSKKIKDFLKVRVENQQDCPRYSCQLILGVKVKESPVWLKKRLKAVGLEPVCNIVDITNYVMLETGQPVHAFDLAKIEKGSSKKAEIIIRRAKTREKILTLDDKIYSLSNKILIIADKKKPLAIAGIKGGKESGISKSTKNVVIEAANFSQKIVRRASQFLKLKTDASLRFEHNIAQKLIDYAQERVAQLIQEIAGGEIAQGMIDIWPKKPLTKKVLLDLKKAEKILGKRLKEREVETILKRLGFKIEKKRKKTFQVEVPWWRLDICLEEDLVEEIGRIEGYQKIKPAFPKSFLFLPKENDTIFWENFIKDRLKELGFIEVYNYSFLSEKNKEIFGLKKEEIVELENPVSSNFKYLRPSLIVNLLEVAKENLKYFDQIKIFEIGKIFKKVKERFLEKRMLAGLLISKAEGGFYELKGILEAVFEQIGLTNFWFDGIGATPEDSPLRIWHPGKTAEIKIGDKEIGFLGQIHPKILKELEIEKEVFIFDIDFEILTEFSLGEIEYRPISPYPAVIRDLAVSVPEGTRVVELLNIINRVGKEIIRDVDLFDIYSGPQVPEGKQSFAFHIVYQAKDRPLEPEEVQKIHNKIISALEKNPEWQVRK